MADPPTARVGPFIDNLKERLKLAMKVQNTIREMDPDAMRKLDDLAGGQDFNNYRLDLMQLSVFLFTDIDHIWLPGVSADIRGDRLFESLQASENLLAICWVPISKIKPAGTYANSYPVLQRKDSNQKVRKDQSERNKVRRSLYFSLPSSLSLVF